MLYLVMLNFIKVLMSKLRLQEYARLFLDTDKASSVSGIWNYYNLAIADTIGSRKMCPLQRGVRYKEIKMVSAIERCQL